MNSYFASVEQQANPQWRGRPVGVASHLAPYACMIATSKEAKARGIVTGMRVIDGLSRAPELVVVEVDPSKYRSVTQRFFRILADYSEQIEPYSIDEAFVNLTGWVQDYAQAQRLIDTIRQRITNEVGEWITCSMGVAPTRWLAKFFSDTAPKGGAVVLRPDQVLPYVHGRALTEAWGIAHRLERRLKAMGIHTLDELYRYPVANLQQSLGVGGYTLWANLHAIELAGVQGETLPKSVGHSHVLKQRTNDRRYHRAVLMKLCERTGRRLRTLGLQAKVFSLGVDTADGWVGGWTAFPMPTAVSAELFRAAAELFEQQVGSRQPHGLAVTATPLTVKSPQLELWPSDERPEKLTEALDELNDRYGEYAVHYGAQAGLAATHAPDRIGFRKTVSWDTPFDQFADAGPSNQG